jgi:WD40 repeat protein
MNEDPNEIATLWSIKTGKVVNWFKENGTINALGFSPDGRTLAAGTSERNRRYEMSNGEFVYNAGTGTVWFTKRNILAKIFLKSHKIKLFHESSIECLDFSPNSQFVITGSSDCTAKVWSNKTGKCIKVLEHASTVGCVKFSYNGEYVLTASWDNTVIVWSGNPLTKLHTFQHKKAIFHAEFSHDNTRVLTSSMDGTAVMWDLITGENLYTIDVNYPIGHVAISPDDKTLLISTWDSITRLYDAKTGRILLKVDYPDNHTDYSYPTFHPKSTLFVTETKSKSVTLWSGTDHKQIYIFKNQRLLKGACFSPDGRYLLTYSNLTVSIWSIETGSLLYELPHCEVLNRASFSPCSRFVLTNCITETG